ncbi:PH domain-containing protein [Quadrisphaera oryzae]|uniref:PH domain-containing protein n=1 Tax=Quadrisphaera TaxID=317661 RepID=UPI0016483869|nr:PH domain-containing protein [Quadrisphaera sp. RL12-1S]
MAEGSTAAAWDDVLREHAARQRPASRAGYVAWLVLVVLLVVFSVLHQRWVGALGLGLSAFGLVLDRRRRLVQRPTTTASGDGLLICAVDRDRYITWDQVLEVYPRAAWASWPTVRTRDGSTVALPGVDDRAAARLEQFAAHLGVGR